MLGGLAVEIERVGSASVEGLAAKPTIDPGVMAGGGDDVPDAIEKP
ncbi:MAG: GrpB family protein [Nitrososphaerales archaeon]